MKNITLEIDGRTVEAGEGTTLRHPRPASSIQVSPVAAMRFLAASSE
ncbi:MAG: hypothetical protein BWY99_00287 [Synergistetes bacterium ADurb.BinA166]|nr:MAG: hypothetical protein BWY99_00287 [Synergistetes bacterium ADurb.BinA166]